MLFSEVLTATLSYLLTLLILTARLCDGYNHQEQLPKCSNTAEQAVSGCLQPMLRFADKVERSNGGVQFAWHGSDIFRKLCNIYSQFKECVQNLACESRTVDAMHASYGYMCGNGYTLFEEHAACFAEIEAMQSYVSCKKVANAAIMKAKNLKGDENIQRYFDELCISMKRYLECSQPVISDRCGSSAWKLVNSVTSDSLRAAVPNCTVK